MGKLIRDKIPDLIEQTGKTCAYHILDDDEYYTELKKKLYEEVKEFDASDDPQELIDIYEVLMALLDNAEIDLDTFLRARAAKAETNGRFESHLYLDEVE